MKTLLALLLVSAPLAAVDIEAQVQLSQRFQTFKAPWPGGPTSFSTPMATVRLEWVSHFKTLDLRYGLLGHYAFMDMERTGAVQGNGTDVIYRPWMKAAYEPRIGFSLALQSRGEWAFGVGHEFRIANRRYEGYGAQNKDHFFLGDTEGVLFGQVVHRMEGRHLDLGLRLGLGYSTATSNAVWAPKSNLVPELGLFTSYRF